MKTLTSIVSMLNSLKKCGPRPACVKCHEIIFIVNWRQINKKLTRIE